MVSGFGRSGHAVGDIPGVRFLVIGVKGKSMIALFKGKTEIVRWLTKWIYNYFCNELRELENHINLIMSIKTYRYRIKGNS